MKLEDVVFERHFLDQAKAKGFTAEQIADAITNPYKITDVLRYPGQKRYCGRGVNGLQGLAVVLDGNRAVTVYLDGVVTPMRPDQKNDKAAINSKRLNGR